MQHSGWERVQIVQDKGVRGRWRFTSAFSFINFLFRIDTSSLSHTQLTAVLCNRARYEEHLASTISTSKRPDIIIAFNSGCHMIRSSWSPAIAAIINSKIPACFTSYTAEEASDDLEFVKDVGEAVEKNGGKTLEIAWSEEPNAWSGGRRRFEFWSRERSWSDNAFWMGFQGVEAVQRRC